MWDRIKIQVVEKIPVEKHLERENAGNGRALEAQEMPRELAVEEAHILNAIFVGNLIVSST